MDQVVTTGAIERAREILVAGGYLLVSGDVAASLVGTDGYRRCAVELVGIVGSLHGCEVRMTRHLPAGSALAVLPAGRSLPAVQ